jgi:hypothetical protein
MVDGGDMMCGSSARCVDPHTQQGSKAPCTDIAMLFFSVHACGYVNVQKVCKWMPRAMYMWPYADRQRGSKRGVAAEEEWKRT